MMAFSFFTCGGIFYWTDRYSYAGWRIQESFWSKRCRLLDPYHIRRASGSFEECRLKLESFVKDWELAIPAKKAVVYIHGLFQTPYAFEKISRRFANHYETMVFSYPMLRAEPTKLAEALNNYLNARPDCAEFNFVATGIGGLILRKAISLNPIWYRKMGRAVFIAVPRNGYAFIEKYKDKWLFREIFGKAGQLLLPEYVSQNIPAMMGEFGVIYGGKAEKNGYLPWLKADNDGMLRVDEAADAAAKEDFLALNRHHFKLLKDEQVLDLTNSFIRSGHFGTGRRIRREQIMKNLWDN